VYAVKWADQDRARAPFSAEWYVLSDELRPAALRLRPDAYNDIRAADASAFDTLVSGRLSNASFAPVRLNYGSTYASKFERLKDGRLLMMTVRGGGPFVAAAAAVVVAKRGNRGFDDVYTQSLAKSFFTHTP
jgi:hypothetical protein